MGKVVSVNISLRRGGPKHPVPEALLKPRHGMVGDAHAGDWHRQISLLAVESVDAMRAACPIPLEAGVFAENITTAGIVLKDLPVGTRLRVGEAELEVTQIGKACHSGCAIRQAAGTCVMPTEGIFAAVVREGAVRPGDAVFVRDTAESFSGDAAEAMTGDAVDAIVGDAAEAMIGNAAEAMIGDAAEAAWKKAGE